MLLLLIAAWDSLEKTLSLPAEKADPTVRLSVAGVSWRISYLSFTGLGWCALTLFGILWWSWRLKVSHATHYCFSAAPTYISKDQIFLLPSTESSFLCLKPAGWNRDDTERYNSAFNFTWWNVHDQQLAQELCVHVFPPLPHRRREQPVKQNIHLSTNIKIPNRPQTTFASIQRSNTPQLGSMLGAGCGPVTQHCVTDKKCNSVCEVVWEIPTTECVQVLIPGELDSYIPLLYVYWTERWLIRDFSRRGAREHACAHACLCV